METQKPRKPGPQTPLKPIVKPTYMDRVRALRRFLREPPPPIPDSTTSIRG